MSVLDDLNQLESRVTNRLRELAPAVHEYEELKQVAQRLGLNVDGPPADTRGEVTAANDTVTPSDRPRSRRRPKASKTSAERSTRRRSAGASRRSGSRREAVLELVKRQPGITVRDIGTELRVDPTSLYRVVRQLEHDGHITKDGKHLTPAAPAA